MQVLERQSKNLTDDLYVLLVGSIVTMNPAGGNEHVKRLSVVNAMVMTV